ncbi:Uncharacterized protein FWK35_00021153 [Aphis craccivora]|uniref:Uncharacterized protein n=1 Tax=Aphis craccivora TaxID=307492 RepID=A0A6G0YAN4_APHCR|nr:Uncharacterized protein FWK35_00021153 [Aphis craccivora]
MRPHSVLQVYNNCLKALHFPQQWESVKLVLLHKGGDKPVDSPSSFRPICLLKSQGKALNLVRRSEMRRDGPLYEGLQSGGRQLPGLRLGWAPQGASQTKVGCVCS